MTYEDSVERYHKFVELREKGWTLKDIGKKFKVTHQGVYLRLKKGLPKSPVRRVGIPKGNGNTILLISYGFTEGMLGGRERTRMLVRIRDKFTCHDCGDIRTIDEVREHNKDIYGLKGRLKLFDVHHTKGMCGKKTKQYDKASDLSGMITLCHKCHYNRPEHKVNEKVEAKCKSCKAIFRASPNRKNSWCNDCYNTEYSRKYRREH